MYKNVKPLGQKAYGSIPHLPYSRLGTGDHHIDQGQALIATKKPRDRNDLIIVQEKLDGSNCSVAKVKGQILALGRSGHLAETSPYAQHQLFAKWVKANEERFDKLLNENERVAGE
jgi:ATP-dependent RNA circularization protein (DNA/RNA ligase family)